MGRHYFITNRQILVDKSGRESVREDGGELAQRTLRFGEVEVKGDQVDWDLYEDLNSSTSYEDQNNDQNGSANLFTNLQEKMTSEEGGDVLFFVHGFNAHLTQVGKILKKLEKTYIYPGSKIKHIVVFTWPAERTSPALHYRRDYADALELENDWKTIT